MACLENLMKTGLITELKGDNSFWVSIGGTAGGSGNGRLRYLKEESGIARPYVRFSFGPNAHSYAFLSNTPVATEVLTYFDIFSGSGGTLEMENIQTYLNAVMDPLSLSLTGYQAMKFRRGPETPMWEEDTNFFHTNILYRGYANPS